MDQGPLVREEIDAGFDFIRHYNQVRPITAAFWLKQEEVPSWYLYIASDEIDAAHRREAYRDAVQVSREHPSDYFDTDAIKVVSSNDPFARAVLTIKSQRPLPVVQRIWGQWHHGVCLDQAYIYPDLIPAEAPTS